MSVVQEVKGRPSVYDETASAKGEMKVQNGVEERKKNQGEQPVASA